MRPSLNLLQDVKILAFTQFLLGPASVQYLADMGAHVIKVEPPGRGSYERRWSGGATFPGGVSAFFLLAHRNVRSLTLDLQQDEGRTIARQLAQESDVVVENFRPGVMERFGLGYEDLSKNNPGLIYATGSGYGSDSPYRNLPGQDLLLQARTGLASVTGRSQEPPTTAGAAVVDQHAASLLAMGILGALHYRHTTGEGQKVEVTMVQAALDLQLEPVVYHLNGGTVQRPREPLASGFHEAPYGFYQTSDGHIALSLSPLKLVSEALGDPPELQPLTDAALALSKREEIHRALSDILNRYTTDKLLTLFGTYSIWCAPVNNYDAAFADPVVDHVDPLLELEHPEAGKVKLLKHPVRYGAGEATVRQAPPKLGEHTTQIMTELGFGKAETTHLHQAGVI